MKGRKSKLFRIMQALASVNDWRTARDISQILAYDITPNEVAQQLRPLTSKGVVEKVRSRDFYSELKYRLKHDEWSDNDVQ